MTTLLLVVSGVGAGIFGALLGLGGGVLIVPLLTLVFGFPLASAVGASLVSVIATSVSAASHYVRIGQADLRLGLSLELTTVLGALVGGTLGGILPDRVLALAFAALLAYVAVTLVRGVIVSPAPRSTTGEADADAEVPISRGRQVVAYAGAGGAGVLSSLLGIGGGIVKVPIVHLVLGRSLPVAVATSTFVIGVTAAAGAYPYLSRGDIDPAIAGPVVFGVAIGSQVGARIGRRIDSRAIAIIFVVVLAYTAYQMAVRGLGA